MEHQNRPSSPSKKELSGVSHATVSNAVPGMEVAYFMSNYKARVVVPQNQMYEMSTVNYSYNSTYGLEILAGRDISESFENDVNRIILNESAVEALGFSDALEAIGEKVILEGNTESVEIVGVLKNFHQQYRDDRRFNQVFGLFTAISILIAILGLWTLVFFEALIMNKSISVRRVFGASHRSLFLGLSRRFLYLIGVSIAVGAPVSYLLMQNWLNQYTFRTDLNWRIFAIAGILNLCITFLTVGGQTYKAATINPVAALKTE